MSEFEEMNERLRIAASQRTSKMDQQRAILDAQSTFVPTLKAPNDQEIDSIIRGEITKLYTKKVGITANMDLAKRIIDLNEDLPAAFRSKFEVMAINAEFASCIQGVINDCNKRGIKLKLVAIESNPKRIEKVGDG